MAATFKKVPRSVQSSERNMAITAVVQGDQINVSSILGRPARRVRILPNDSGDTIVLKYNNRVRMPVVYATNEEALDGGVQTATPVYVVSHGAHYPSHTYTGSSEYYTEEFMTVSFITVESITFGGGGTSISIEVW